MEHSAVIPFKNILLNKKSRIEESEHMPDYIKHGRKRAKMNENGDV